MKQTIFIIMAMLVALTTSAQKILVVPATDSTFYIFETDFAPIEYDSAQVERRLTEIKAQAESVVGTFYRRLEQSRTLSQEASDVAQQVLGIDSLAVEQTPDSTFNGWYVIRINGTVYDDVRVRNGRIQSQELPEMIRLRAVNEQSFYLKSATLVPSKTYMIRTDNLREIYKSSEADIRVVLRKKRDL